MAQQQEQATREITKYSALSVRTMMSRLWVLTKRNPTMMAGIAIVLVMVILALLAPLLNTIDPKEIDPRNRFLSPSSDTWFGSDNVGRDVYSRTIYGTRVSLIVGFAVAVISTFSAAMVGVVSGYYRKPDAVIMRVMDGLMSIPSVLLAMALMALLGGSVQNVIIALCVVETPRAIRIVRSSVLSLREQMFVDAARALGSSPLRDPLHPHPAEHTRPAHRAGNVHRRGRYPRGGVSELPRRRTPTRCSQLGEHHG